MTVYAAPGSTFEGSVSNGATGLTGTIGVRITNLATDVDFLARVTAGITEFPVGSGIYSRSFTAPTVAATYAIIWDTGGGTPVYTSEDLVVTSTAPGASVPAGSDLCTLADVKLAIGITGATDDNLLQTLITAASTAIAIRYQREFAPVAGTPTRIVRSDGRLVTLAPYDLRSASAISFDPAGTPVALAATDWRYGFLGTGGVFRDLRLRDTYSLSSTSFSEYGYYEVAITGTWGFAAIPVDVARAAVLTTAAWLDRGADQIAQMDSTVRPDGSTFAASWAIPNAAHSLLRPYERMAYV